MNECRVFFYFEMAPAPERWLQKAGSGPDFSRPPSLHSRSGILLGSRFMLLHARRGPGATQRTCLIHLPKGEPGRIMSIYQAQVGKD